MPWATLNLQDPADLQAVNEICPVLTKWHSRGMAFAWYRIRVPSAKLILAGQLEQLCPRAGLLRFPGGCGRQPMKFQLKKYARGPT